jgi:CheY-like chemotaxis protein
MKQPAPCILVADDDLDRLEVLKEALSQRCYVIHAVPTGDAAFEYLEHNIPDVVIISSTLRWRDGREAVSYHTKAIRNSTRSNKNSLIIMLGRLNTVVVSSENRIFYLSEPISVSFVLRIIEEFWIV